MIGLRPSAGSLFCLNKTRFSFAAATDQSDDNHEALNSTTTVVLAS